jgi:hypothetical protein
MSNPMTRQTAIDTADTPQENAQIHARLGRKYDAGFVTDIESDSLPPGLSEDIIRALSARKDEPEWMTEWRLAAYRQFLTMPVPHWAKLSIEPIDLQALSYYSAPKGPKYASLADVPQELLDTYEKLGVPLHERAKLAGVAVDVVFDSVSVGTTFRKELAEKGIVFCSMSEAIHDYPELVRQYLGSVVPVGDNYFAALNSAVFSDGSFVFIPKGVRCPMELSTYFRINAATPASSSAPDRRRGIGLRLLPGRLHRADARREPAARGRGRTGRAGRCRDQVQHRAELVPRRRGRQGRHLQLRDQARRSAAARAARSRGRRWKPVRRSPGSTRAACCWATTASASSIRWR